jgi:hypothetical protein
MAAHFKLLPGLVLTKLFAIIQGHFLKKIMVRYVQKAQLKRHDFFWDNAPQPKECL